MRIASLAIVGITLATQLAAQWFEAVAAAPPGRLYRAAMVTDVTGDVLLFGGRTFPATGFVTNKTWSFDGANWTLRPQTVSPPAGWGMRLVLDSLRSVVVAYGGYQTSVLYPPLDETWEWNGATWTRVYPAHTPGGLGFHGMSYDAIRHRVVVFGGTRQNQQDVAETWEYDGVDWTQVTTANHPFARRDHSMCFHAGSGRTVLFGGVNLQLLSDSVTWTYDGSDWTPLPILGATPGARIGACFDYDSVRDVCVLTAGAAQSPPGIATDTWEFDGTSWAAIPTSIVVHDGAAMAFDANRRQMVLHGGNMGTVLFPDDTWTYGASLRGFGSGCVGTNGVPTLMAAHGPRLGQSWSLTVANLNPAVNLVLLVCGFAPTSAVDLGFLGMPGCEALTSLDIMVGVAGGGGAANWSWPSVAGTFGASFFCQALALDPPANAAGLTLSNALAATLGF